LFRAVVAGSMTLMELAAVVAAVLVAAVAAFRVALAAGLPLGEATMGGRAATVDGVLQTPYRAMAFGSAVVLVLAAWIVLGRAGMVPIVLDSQALVWSAWVVTGFHGAEHLDQPVWAAPAGAIGHEYDDAGCRPPRRHVAYAAP
jgi:hypothetical protein